MPSRLTRWLTAALLLTALQAVAAPTKRKKVAAPPPAPAAKVESELKSAPTLPPVVAVPDAPAPLSALPPPVVQRQAEPELTALPKLGRRAGLSVQATGGVLVPFTSLGVGGRAELRAAYVRVDATNPFDVHCASCSFGAD